MTQKLLCNVPCHPIAYEIEIGHKILDIASYLAPIASKFAILTDEKVATLYGEAFYQSLKAAGLSVDLFSFPEGEAYKTAATKAYLETQMFEKGFGRDSGVIAFGGGVVTDLAGYVAATYCRGIPLVMVPTTLLGMVDASIGGKTGINVAQGKNLVGSIYQPKKVVIDTSLLQRLPLKELANGAVEMIKHGLIADAKVFEYLEVSVEPILSLDSLVLERAIFDSCRIKKEIVEQDEKEKGKRHLLNFGHTVGHALEKITNYALSHGEAVAIGLLVENHLSVQLGILNPKTFDRIQQALMKYKLPLKLPRKLPIEVLLDAMALDKKSVRGNPRFVMIEEIGVPLAFEGNYCTPVEESFIKKALQWMNDALCGH